MSSLIKAQCRGNSGPLLGFWFPSLWYCEGYCCWLHALRMWEGIVDQHLEKWFGSGENTLFPCHLGEHIEAIERYLHSIRPTSEITPKPRKLAERHDWKASEKKALLLYYSIPILVGRLPEKYMQHYMLLVGAIHRLLKCSISPNDLEEAPHFSQALLCTSARFPRRKVPDL